MSFGADVAACLYHIALGTHQYALPADILETSLTQSSEIQNHQAGQVQTPSCWKSLEIPAGFSLGFVLEIKTEQNAVMVGQRLPDKHQSLLLNKICF